MESRTVAARVETERRLTDRLTLELESRLVGSVDPRNALQSFRNDSFVTVRVRPVFLITSGGHSRSRRNAWDSISQRTARDMLDV